MHTQLGARIGPAIPRSLHIAGTVGDWESSTGRRFPETGDYVFPAGLATVHIDRDSDIGEYWEPNIWNPRRQQPDSGLTAPPHQALASQHGDLHPC